MNIVEEKARNYARDKFINECMEYGACGESELYESHIDGYKQAIKDIKEWIDNNLSGYITNDGDWTDIEHKFMEEFGTE